MLILPMKHQVDDAAWSRLAEHFAGLAEREPGDVAFERNRPQRILRSMLAGVELKSLDLLQGLRRAGLDSGSSLYWRRDQHLNGLGHQAAALLIAKALRHHRYGGRIATETGS